MITSPVTTHHIWGKAYPCKALTSSRYPVRKKSGDHCCITTVGSLFHQPYHFYRVEFPNRAREKIQNNWICSRAWWAFYSVKGANASRQDRLRRRIGRDQSAVLGSDGEMGDWNLLHYDYYSIHLFCESLNERDWDRFVIQYRKI